MAGMRDGSGDFNFEIGAWVVRHRRLKLRLAGSVDWETFGGTSRMWTVLGGAGNIEDNSLEFPGGAYRAVALRSYDPGRSAWAIWWLSTQDPHRIDVPVTGRFEAGLGAFYAQDMLRGMPVRVRFLWLRTDTAQPRWEQALSADGGQTWETNWTMDFDRA